MKNAILSSLLATLLLPLAASAADEGQLVDVVATGHGSTVREATKAALRAAVEQVVGTMVDATTLVENDELIEDEILQYSAGMVESSKTIGEPKKSADGFYTVKVKATVRKGKLEEKLRTASAVNVALDGADLFARMTAAQDNLADAEAMIKDVLAKHLACVVAEAVPGENGKSPLDLDPKTGEVFANVRVRVDMAKYKQFVKELLDKFGPMAKGTVDLVGTNRNGGLYSGTGDIEFDLPKQDATEFGIIVLENPKTGKAQALFFDKNQSDLIRENMKTGSVAVRIALTDSNGEEITFRTEACDQRDKEQRAWSTCISLFGCSKSMGLVVPFFGGILGYREWNGNPRMQYYTNSNVTDRFETTKSLKTSIGFFTADELKSAGKLEIKVGHMKDGQFTE